jgi:O-antigen/teichoic acid export membrane protein
MSNNKTIAKNTLFLYIRMLLTMVVSFYTSRIVLEQLGVSDYGIYTLVGGIVAMFGFFNAAMTIATQRYLTIDIGEGNLERLQKTFSATLTIHIGIALFVLVIAETIGLWYVNYVMVFSQERLIAVNIVYQFSIAATFLGILQIPYNALIIAKERMKVFAYVSILEALLKLSAVSLLIFFGEDKLITYAILIFVVATIIRFIYQKYCRKNFIESHYKFEYDKNSFKELMTFTGWNSLGSIALLVSSQGNNLILNLFFGTTANAAFGVTLLVQGIVLSFAQNFQTAVNPQIVKTYAKSNFVQMQNLIFQTSKYSFFLLFILVTPILLNTDYILKLWLRVIPEGTTIMLNLALINILIEILSFSLIVGIQAKGNVKYFQIALGGLVLLNLPISYLVLKLGGPPYSVFIVLIVISIFALILRLHFFTKLLGFASLDFFKKVFFPTVGVFSVSLALHFFVTIVFELQYKAATILQLIAITLIYGILTVFIIILFGINKSEKKFLMVQLKKVT